MKLHRWFILLCAALLTLTSACGSEEPTTLAGAGGSNTGEGKGGDKYVAGLEKTGENGLYTLKLLQSDPIPKDTGIYTWTLQLLDANGAPVSNASIEAEPRMEAHDHGTFPPITDAAAVAGDGTYELKSMDLFMPGMWWVHIRILDGEDVVDRVIYQFDLEG